LFVCFWDDLKACPSEWGLNKVGKTINWPDQTVGAAGSSGVAGELLSTEFGIGYLSSGHGLGAGLPEVQLQNEVSVHPNHPCTCDT
jgi:ABC-type phosphate transport system substrate-binding protein